MEKQLFTWDGFDQHDTMVFGFYDVTLQRDLEPFKKGDTFAVASLNYEDGTIELFKGPSDEEPCYHGKLLLSVEP